jgi:hypothetical protein
VRELTMLNRFLLGYFFPRRSRQDAFFATNMRICPSALIPARAGRRDDRPPKPWSES